MQILIDADGCPVVDATVRLAKQYHIPCVICCDTSHHFDKNGATTLIFPKGADSVDFAVANRTAPGDIVITQDYGLAAMCLAKKAMVLDQNGREYTQQNIDGLLDARHMAQKVRKSGGRSKGPRKRTADQDRAFEISLSRLLDLHCGNQGG